MIYNLDLMEGKIMEDSGQKTNREEIRLSPPL